MANFAFNLWRKKYLRHKDGTVKLLKLPKFNQSAHFNAFSLVGNIAINEIHSNNQLFELKSLIDQKCFK